MVPLAPRYLLACCDASYSSLKWNYSNWNRKLCIQVVEVVEVVGVERREAALMCSCMTIFYICYLHSDSASPLHPIFSLYSSKSLSASNFSIFFEIICRCCSLNWLSCATCPLNMTSLKIISTCLQRQRQRRRQKFNERMQSEKSGKRCVYHVWLWKSPHGEEKCALKSAVFNYCVLISLLILISSKWWNVECTEKNVGNIKIIRKQKTNIS